MSLFDAPVIPKSNFVVVLQYRLGSRWIDFTDELEFDEEPDLKSKRCTDLINDITEPGTYRIASFCFEKSSDGDCYHRDLLDQKRLVAQNKGLKIREI